MTPPSAPLTRVPCVVQPVPSPSRRSGPDAEPRPLAEVMQRVQDGDEDSFRELYDRTATAVSGTALRTLRAADHAAEVVQEVYLHAWQHARDFDPRRGSVCGWLLVLTHRRAVDRVRAVTRSVARDHRGFVLAEATAGEVPDVADLGVARCEAARVRAAIARLAPRQREAIVLTYLEGCTHREAALRLRVPLGTLKTRVRDGLGALRVQLDVVAA